jgi:hypothetical protein
MTIKLLLLLAASIIALSLLSIFGVQAYFSQNPNNYQQKVSKGQLSLNFKSLILASDRKIVDLTNPLELRTYDEFKTIYNNPTIYMNEALKALSSKDFTEQQKKIIALSMQNLKIAEYISFSRKILSLLEEKKVTNSVFNGAVFPGYEWNTKLVDYSSSADVNKFLSEVMESNAVSEENKKYIRDSILTGQAKKDIQYLREIGAINNN